MCAVFRLNNIKNFLRRKVFLMRKEFLTRLKKKTQAQWILFGLIVIGIFLRTYHFQQLLVFASDQFRDFELVKSVVIGHSGWPLLGPDMTGGQGFRLGPIYYYFQIISAKVFGISPISQAYPDLFFSILSIPLLYYFLRRYFSEKTALLSTTVYVFSYFSVEYSRFAWNVNLIPFFVLLFLLSFEEFLSGEEKTGWKWIFGGGMALGVGIQLHAILLLLLLAIAIAAFIFLLVRNKRVWKKIIIIVLMTLVLNIPQFVSEGRSNFANTKIFFKAFFFKSQRSGGTILKGLALDVACNAQANTHILSSLGNKDICDFLYDSQQLSTTYKTPIVLDRQPWSLFGKFVSLLFSVLGCGFLLYHFFKDSGRKKYFSGLLILYGLLYFLIMIPIAPGSRMRYYLPIIFLPFVFLSFIFEFLIKKCSQKWNWLIGLSVCFLLLTNLNSMRLRLGETGCSREAQANFGCNLPLEGTFTRKKR